MLAFFNPLTPFPGTPLYGEMQAQSRLKFERWWLTPEYRWGDVVFEPKHFSARDLADACRRCWYSFYHPKSIFSRAALPANRRRLAESLALNYLIRKEVWEKQGLALGQRQSPSDTLSSSS